ncbi:NEDD8-activating enzyme E1 regulatory subunit [Syncephalis pseudoplumigaleata]|uniref:NEDD8-activating enzyme E1 regulatory subunit n=1 Tax=Syncephalis pseudoplumigaleata TaxID=1712513 RepID=A0A4P9YVN4_9FUNG|nr:NEDD8-activating enzyme E1 regulatory subunit [Syncephalis pseudoplumigaleata]|eukprot:RKP23875.1 NEDD8-activating enzyme E1 regulatory subunit [Syncephalis pseudoplumigaleata]
MDTKTQRYDRQLRLWQASGQMALESAHVCLVNGTATGTEILKNLVLPGIGAYTVVDPARTTGADVGNNFFLRVEDIGEHRAAATCALLAELNPDVEKHAYATHTVAELLAPEAAAMFDAFTMVVAVDVPEADLLALAARCWQTQKPLVVVRVCGFFGYLRVVGPEHTVVDTHPDHMADLRLYAPFPALLEYAARFESMDTMSNADHGHVPYVVILLKYLEQFRMKHGRLPGNYQEKNELKTMIRAGMRASDEENFHEAMDAVLRSCTKPEIPSSIQALFNDPACEQLTPQSSNFWILLRAMRDFTASSQGAGLLPLSGTLPDMKSDTENYVALQQIYRQKAQADCHAVHDHVRQHLARLHLPSDRIGDEEVAAFCKHAAFLQVIRYRSLADEYVDNPPTEQLTNELADPSSEAIRYVMFRAAEQFYEQYQRYPGKVAAASMQHNIHMCISIAV